MLSLRMILTIVAAGIALWGLFSLLENLSEPGLLRSADRAVVKGCDTLETEQARQSCPPLICQRDLFNARSFSQRSLLSVTTDTTRGPHRLIAVSASEGGAAPAQFVCIMQREKVLLARPAQTDEIERAIESDRDWLEALSVTMAP